MAVVRFALAWFAVLGPSALASGWPGVEGEGEVSQGRQGLCAWWQPKTTVWNAALGLLSIEAGGCTSTPPPTRVQHLPCATAEFGSPWPNDTGTFAEVVSAKPTEACTLDGAAVTMEGRAVLAVRGQCSFEDKAVAVARAGARILIVADIGDAFPMGSSGDCREDLSSLRAVMVGAEAGALVDALSSPLTRGAVCFGMLPEGSTLGPGEDSDSTGAPLHRSTLVVLAFLLLSMSLASMGSEVSLESLALTVVVLTVGYVRLSTALRRLDVQAGLSAVGIGDDIETSDWVYDHRETDELVYRVLVSRVRDLGFQRGYSLEGTPVLRALNLAPENYAFPVFHHPPAFILFSLTLESTGLPYPAVPVLLSLGTLLLAVRLSSNLALPPMSQLWTGVVLAFCPLSWWCSQKFWLDNGLAFLSTLVLVLATWPLPKPGPGEKTSAGTWVWRTLLVGFGLGASVWCKVTAIFGGPGVALVSFLHLQQGKRLELKAFFLHAIGLCLVMATVYSPWLAWYHYHTGRWLPSALPSTSMLSSSPLVAAAVSQPVHFYVSALVSLHPVYGLCVLSSPRNLRLGGIAAYCLSFLGALVGVAQLLGGGSQLRFVLPLVPPMAVLTGQVLNAHRRLGPIAAGLLCLGAMHCMLYGVLFAPLSAEIGTAEDGALFKLLGYAQRIAERPVPYPRTGLQDSSVPLAV